jgi:nicotinamide riboside transporter PnuC
MAFLWGLTFASLAALSTWVVTPVVRIIQFSAAMFGNIYATVIHLVCDPINYSFGLIFSRFRHHFEFKPYPRSLGEE